MHQRDGCIPSLVSAIASPPGSDACLNGNNGSAGIRSRQPLLEGDGGLMIDNADVIFSGCLVRGQQEVRFIVGFGWPGCTQPGVSLGDFPVDLLHNGIGMPIVGEEIAVLLANAAQDGP